MTTLNFSNVVGTDVRVISTDTIGKLTFPILILDSPIESGDSWSSNSGESPSAMSAEMSTLRDKPANAQGWDATFAIGNTPISLPGGATLSKSSRDYGIVFALNNNISVLSSYLAIGQADVSAVFTAIKGTNGVYAIGGGSWTGTQEQLIYNPCALDRAGYATFIGPLKGGASGPLGGGFILSAQATELATEWINAYTTPLSTDPYAQGGESEGHVGGDGTYSDESDPIPIPPEPALSAANTGFIRIYNPTMAELQSLANYMWSGLFDLDTFKKIFSDPISCILGLSIVPVAVPNGGVHSVVIGNVDTEILMMRAQSQYVTVDCGSLTISEYWGAYLDYAPFTKFELYLPYIGIRPISADDVMGKTVSITYRVDILSGSCIAYVKCGASVLYSFMGQCSSSIPITGQDWTNVINGALNIAGAIGTVVATGGFSAPAAIAGTAAGAMYQTGKLMTTGASLAQNVASMKPQIEKSGSLSGTGGMLGIQKPYLIITRPKQALPAQQNRYMGYPSFVTVVLGDISGYTEVDSIHLENIPATSSELDEIETLLKGGVIL